MLAGEGGLADGIAVVGAVRGHRVDTALCLSRQGWCLGRVVRMTPGQDTGGDPAAAAIHGKVEPAPLPPGAAVPVRSPLALPEQLQAGAVRHEVHGPVTPDNPGLASGKGATASGQGRVARHCHPGTGQAWHAAGERLGLAQRQREDEPHGRHQLDREVGAAGLPARRGPARCLPAGERCIVDPERQVAAPPRDTMTSGSVVLERHASDVAGLLAPDYPGVSVHQRPVGVQHPEQTVDAVPAVGRPLVAADRWKVHAGVGQQRQAIV